jgi:hypothetical protein
MQMAVETKQGKGVGITTSQWIIVFLQVQRD